MQAKPLQVLLCARESNAAQWQSALAEALRGQGVAAEVWWRDAAQAQADPAARQADVAIVWRPPAALFDEQRQLKLVFCLGAGVDALLALPNLPAEAALLRLEDAGMAGALAEYVLAAVLRTYRGFDRYTAQQRQASWQPLELRDKRDYLVGVLGLGVIGGAIAATLQQHGFRVRGFSRSKRKLEGIECHAGDVRDFEGAFGTFLAQLDVLVSVLPLTADNRGALDRRALGRLASGAHLINAGRGAHVVDADLLALLDAGHLSGATLDVFDTEPLPAEHPFWSRPQILLTPHVSAVTQLGPAALQVAQKLAAWARGGVPTGRVNRARGY